MLEFDVEGSLDGRLYRGGRSHEERDRGEVLCEAGGHRVGCVSYGKVLSVVGVSVK